MNVIRSHTILLRDSELVLRPLTDAHLPLLYKWSADPEVLYWTEGGARNLSYSPETVRQIYGAVSQNALCFLAEAGGVPIGECWLQKMNLPYIQAMYAPGTDVRRIDMCIGEKVYWGKGYGTRLLGLLVDFAFCSEQAEVLHCLCGDYNERSCRVWKRHGFRLAKEENSACHYRLTQQEYRRRKGEVYETM